MFTKVVQAEDKSKIYFDFVEAQPTFMPSRKGSAAEDKSKIYFDFVEAQPTFIPSRKGSATDERSKGRGQTWSLPCKEEEKNEVLKPRTKAKFMGIIYLLIPKSR